MPYQKKKMRKFTKRQYKNKRKAKSVKNRKRSGGTGGTRGRAMSPTPVQRSPDQRPDKRYDDGAMSPTPVQRSPDQRPDKRYDDGDEYSINRASKFLEEVKSMTNPEKFKSYLSLTGWAEWAKGRLLSDEEYDLAVRQGDSALRTFVAAVPGWLRAGDTTQPADALENFQKEILGYFKQR